MFLCVLSTTVAFENIVELVGLIIVLKIVARRGLRLVIPEMAALPNIPLPLGTWSTNFLIASRLKLVPWLNPVRAHGMVLLDLHLSQE